MIIPTPILVLIIAFVGLMMYFVIIANAYGAPFVPTPMKAVRRMLELAAIKPGEVVADIGCGDGRLPILADQVYHAQAFGFELSPPIYLYAKLRIAFKKIKTKALIAFKDSRYINLSDVDAVVLFMMPDPLRNFWKQKFEHELKPSARVISYAFSVQGWNPSHVEPPIKEENIGPIYVYKMSEIY